MFGFIIAAATTAVTVVAVKRYVVVEQEEAPTATGGKRLKVNVGIKSISDDDPIIDKLVLRPIASAALFITTVVVGIAVVYIAIVMQTVKCATIALRYLFNFLTWPVRMLIWKFHRPTLMA